MEMAVSYDSQQIKQLIQDDFQRKLNVHVPLDKIEIKVKSKQNYRNHEWENGDLKLDMKVEI
ncbi:hypothetical protein PP655_gp035 [Bacillus phage PBC4]|uniref:Uncharacterized protein n=2 Tax=Yihwangvirus TaxID=3044863 RepID=A0A1D6X878_9CAUD|nr:hypothetical protein PP655_gp035 [Bacillus phage PBC4]YP_010657201.1 hypothetical protein PP656_gp075 [Bacillus phage pW4]AKQ08227.1 hypothetical protein PBC4_035 [Bacillus phage PBC4]AZU99079.1 hypothetical protein pW4_60 [Bacillus phage pW4]